MNPFIPYKRADLVIVDGRASEDIIKALRSLNLRVITTIKCNEVDESISYHPDIVIHPINHNTLIIAPNVFDYYEDRLKGLGIKLIRGEKYLDRKYPLDIAYNVGRINNLALHNFKHTDEKLKFYLKKENIDLIDINQGYAKCSMAVISKDRIITSDLPIYSKLHNLGFSPLLIQPGHILLEGQKYGFIGGATGNICHDTILLSGNIDEHPNKAEIMEFVKESNKKIIFLSKEKIVDLGTIICLNSN